MPVPLMPSLTDLPIEELKKEGAALQVIADQLGEIKDNKGEGNCGYYAVAIGFKHLKKIWLETLYPKVPILQIKRLLWQ